MTFIAHKAAGGSLHLVLGAVGLWFISLLLGAVGYGVPAWLVVVVAYGAFASGSYFGGFPDTEDKIVADWLGIIQRWEIYHRCHVGDLKLRLGWIPGWAYHLFCDLFAHEPKDPLKPRWWEMKLEWKEKKLIFGLSLWDLHYSYREAAVWLIAAVMFWAGSAIILSVAHVVITIVK